MNAAIFARHDGVWLNEPERWTAQDDSLEIVTDKATDFWQKTHYGFCRDSGHFLGFQTAEAFTAELRVKCDFQELYDQAGIMVRIDAEHWVKAGIEFFGRARHAFERIDQRAVGLGNSPLRARCRRFLDARHRYRRRSAIAGVG